jgi:hypothetical protein
VQTSATMNLYFNAIAPALQSNKQYSIRVRATISGVVGNYGSACTIGFTNGSRSEIESNYSLDETINNNGFKLNVYPNPFNDKLNLIIQTQITEKAQIQIFDMMGNLILQTQINSNENMSFGNELAAGNYMIRVIAENGAQEIRSVIKSN